MRRLMMSAPQLSRTSLSNVLTPRVSPSANSARSLVTSLAESLSRDGHMSFAQAVQAFERAWIVGALIRYNFNQCLVAKRLDMHRNTLARKISEYAIEMPRAKVTDRIAPEFQTLHTPCRRTA